MKTKRNTAGQFLPGTHWREPQDFRDRDWLVAEYVVKKRSLGDIAKQFGVSEPAIRFWMKRHDIPRRTTSEARKVKHWGAVGSDNPMWNKKGELNPMWKGGVTPERQAFYASAEWRSACRAVYARDRGFCRRCTLHRRRNTGHTVPHPSPRFVCRPRPTCGPRQPRHALRALPSIRPLKKERQP